MKPTIEEALQQRLPLPWKQSTCDGPPQWKVERQRLEDFTAEIYQQLRKYGMMEDEIRTLFYISNEDYARLKKQVGAVPPMDDEDEPKAKPKKNRGSKTAAIVIDPPWSAIAPTDRPKIAVEPAPEAVPHEPTAEEIADVFRPEDDLPVPFELVEATAKTLEFTDGPSGSSAKLTEFKLPQVPSEKIQITCHGYSLKQLKAFLFAMPDDTAISGVIHISLRGSESNHGT